jgi:hypothetical protein
MSALPPMKVRRLTGTTQHTRCTAQVHRPSFRSNTQAHRERLQRQYGLSGQPGNPCVQRATHEIDGLPYCRNHAGGIALQYLEANTDAD